MISKNLSQKGFTLVETVLALFIGALLSSAIYVLIVAGQRSSGVVERKVAAQQDTRAALEIMALEIGMASYNPTFQADFWVNPNACQGLSDNQSYKGIQLATPTSLTVEMDVTQNSRIFDSSLSSGTDCNDPDRDCNEIIAYNYNPVSQYISRKVNCGPPMPFLGANPASGLPRSVRVINGDLGVLNGRGDPAVFRYFDGRHPAGELYPYVNPADYAHIRRIDITLGVETEDVDPNTKARRRMIYSTSVIPRNHPLTP